MFARAIYRGGERAESIFRSDDFREKEGKVCPALRGKLTIMKDIPVYRYPASYAEEHNQLNQYGASYRANLACKKAIEDSINRHYDGVYLDEAAVTEVLEGFGADRVLFVLANTIQNKDWDRRFSPENRQWAKTVVFHPDADYGGDRRRHYVVDKCHPGLTNLFLDEIRREHPELIH